MSEEGNGLVKATAIALGTFVVSSVLAEKLFNTSDIGGVARESGVRAGRNVSLVTAAASGMTAFFCIAGLLSGGALREIKI